MEAQVSTPALPRSRFSRWRRHELWFYFGPAFIASVAYIDPGNFFTNIDGGARFGYQLLWVLLWSNLVAMLVQFLSAKLGIATGRTLPQLCRERFQRPTVIGLWVIAEIAAIFTDIAEFVGAATGFYLLLHVSLLTGALLAAVAVFLILAVEVYGFRRLEHVIMLFVAVIALAYFYEIFLSQPDWRTALKFVAVPRLTHSSAYLAVAMLGATVMPHVIYLHSALVLHRYRPDDPTHSLQHARYELFDVLVAMNGSWLVNSAMLIMAADVFFRHGIGPASIEQAHQTLGPILGRASAAAFAIALLCSGLSSSVVGTMAGQVVIEGFLDINFNIFYRRAITVVPAVLAIASGMDPVRLVVFTQAALSFALPFAMVPLLLIVQDPKVMGRMAVQRTTAVLGWIASGAIILLNVYLLYSIFTGSA